MAVAQSNNRSRSYIVNCHRIPSLTAPILESSQTSRLEDHYILGEQLGWGQFGVIRVCSNIYTGENFACKSIAKDRLITPEDVHSIKLEIEIMSQLAGHPNVVGLKAVYEEENYVHIVMELCAGGELFHRIERNGRFPEHKACILFRHLMEVVMYCHNKGVVHRDLKPENILLATKSASSPIKLADFGLATYIRPGQSLYGTVGSPFYIAPEVLAGGYNQAADVWSAGVILYILLSGIPPFWGKTKSRIFDAVRTTELQFPSDPWDHVSASAKDLIAGMLCRDASQRLTAAQVLGHSWFTNFVDQYHGSERQTMASCAQMELGRFSFSSPLNHNFSFGSGSPVTSDSAQFFSPPALSCKSSFSSFLVGATAVTPRGGFSFRSCGDSGSLEFSSPIQSMPSFAFVSSSSPRDQSEINHMRRESSFGKLFSSSDIPTGSGHDIRELGLKTIDVKRVSAAASRGSGMHSKRNRTIGLGECEQLDVMVTDSVIRWASCHLFGAASLRSSLVC